MDAPRPDEPDTLRAENAALRERLEETQDTLRAITEGQVDAFVVGAAGAQRVYTLEGADRVYRMWVEKMQQGAATLAGDARIGYSNLRLAELLGEPLETLLGGTLRRYVPADRQAEFDDALARASGGGSALETLLRRADGMLFPVLLTFSALAPSADAIGLLVTDLTMQRQHEQLTRALAERERLEGELRAALADLSTSDRRKSEFLAVLAHELRNPLAPISNGLQILRLGTGDARPTLTMMQRHVTQIVRLVDDLLDMGRIDSGKIELRRRATDLVALVRDAVEAADTECRRLDQTLEVDLPETPIPLDADPERLTQVIGNLLHNAVKFTPPGGRIRVGAAREAGQVVVRVGDDGIGIAPDQLGRVFELFAQVDQSLDRSRGGLGLGLTLVRELVGLHGGSVEAHSEGLGRGSEFVVRLPLRDAPSAAVPVPAAPERAGSALRILVVDDNRDAAESLATLLRLGGHEVLVAHDGDAAVETALAERPQLALLDIGLPGLDGFEAARRIRERLDADALRLVAVTGWGQEEDRRRSNASGFDAHLVKPVDPAALDALIAALAR